ncbi:MAG: thioredoxin-disulfide reductase [Planctomycetes bacterium]|nr:thioredoxin-disulfide reductase [Planctomycetota bacterium]
MSSTDVAVVGGGPAGLSAAIYLARAAIGVTVFRAVSPPSQIIYATMLENYPGIDAVDGFTFVENLANQARKFGAEVTDTAVTLVEKNDSGFTVTLEGAPPVKAKAVVLATGNRSRTLDVPGEAELTGKGVSYCGTCDGALFRGRNVAVVGGGNTAAEDGAFLSRIVKSVTLVHRRDRMRAEPALAERFLSQPNVTPLWNTVVEKINGSKSVESMTVHNVDTGETSDVAVEGVFVFVGGIPNTSMVKGLVRMDEGGYIVTDEVMGTDVPGLYAAGDCRSKEWRQVVTAAGEGAQAAYSAQKYVEALEGRAYPGR